MIRPVEERDHPAIRAVVTAAFVQPKEAQIVEAIRADGDMVLELVSDEGGDITGHVTFSAMQAPAVTVGLAPLAVRPDQQRQGIGTRLAQNGISRLQGTAFKAIFVLNDPPYYYRFGFSTAAATPFESAYPADHLMALDLGGLAGLAGPLRYAAAIEDG